MQRYAWWIRVILSISFKVIPTAGNAFPKTLDISWCNTTRYEKKKAKTLSRIWNKSHPIPRPCGRAMAVFSPLETTLLISTTKHNNETNSGYMFGYLDDVIKWKHFPRYWSFVRGIHRSTVNSPHKGHWRGALMVEQTMKTLVIWDAKSFIMTPL